MANAWVFDRWIKTADDGTELGRTLRRKLISAADPSTVGVPMKFRTDRFGVGARWQVMWYTTDADGRRRLRKKSFEKFSDADSWRAAMDDDLRRGRYRDPNAGRKLFGEVAAGWIRSKVNLRASTAHRYERELRCYVLPKWGDMPVSAVTADALQTWVSELKGGTAPAVLPSDRMRVQLAPSSIRSIVKVVCGGVLGYAVEQGWLERNPVERIALPKRQTADEDLVFLSIEDVERLAECAEQVGKRNDSRHWENGVLIRWQAYVGTRIGEALALRVKDVDFERRRCRVRETWSDDGTYHPTLTLPKNGKARTVAWPASLAADLHRLCDGWDGEDFLFRSPRGGAWTVNNWRARVWGPALKAAGLEDSGATIHSLRHTYASLAIKSGADVKTLQSQLGHASATMTLDIYAALWPENLGSVADAVDAAVSAVVSKHNSQGVG